MHVRVDRLPRVSWQRPLAPQRIHDAVEVARGSGREGQVREQDSRRLAAERDLPPAVDRGYRTEQPYVHVRTTTCLLVAPSCFDSVTSCPAEQSRAGVGRRCGPLWTVKTVRTLCTHPPRRLVVLESER